MTEPVYIDLAEAATHAGMTPNGVRRWIKQGLLPSYQRSGSRRILVRADQLAEFLTPVKVTP